jgi:type IV secretion system protein VirB10
MVQPAPRSYSEAAPAAHTLFAGTIVPAMLITGINSELAGDILAQVSRDVYSSDQRALVIPKGSRLIGRYDDQIALGQNRLVVAWTRLLLPDGRSISFPGLPTQDPRGASGIRDRVNNHYMRTFGNAILLSAVGAGLQLSQPRQGNVFAAPSTGQVAAASVGQELSGVATEAIRRNMNLKPTVEIRPGTPFVVFLNGDLELEPYQGYPVRSPAGQK